MDEINAGGCSIFMNRVCGFPTSGSASLSKVALHGKERTKESFLLADSNDVGVLTDSRMRTIRRMRPFHVARVKHLGTR